MWGKNTAFFYQRKSSLIIETTETLNKYYINELFFNLFDNFKRFNSP